MSPDTRFADHRQSPFDAGAATLAIHRARWSRPPERKAPTPRFLKLLAYELVGFAAELDRSARGLVCLALDKIAAALSCSIDMVKLGLRFLEQLGVIQRLGQWAVRGSDGRPYPSMAWRIVVGQAAPAEASEPAEAPAAEPVAAEPEPVAVPGLARAAAPPTPAAILRPYAAAKLRRHGAEPDDHDRHLPPRLGSRLLASATLLAAQHGTSADLAIRAMFAAAMDLQGKADGQLVEKGHPLLWLARDYLTEITRGAHALLGARVAPSTPPPPPPVLGQQGAAAVLAAIAAAG